jgi:small nuclear ribonucleoprotein (snRNP)-like protein
MTDGRIVHGKFICLDRLGNIILDSAVEYRQIVYIPPPSVALSSEDRENGNFCDENNMNDKPRRDKFTWITNRSLSQAVIKGNRLAKVEIAKSDWENRMGNAP